MPKSSNRKKTVYVFRIRLSDSDPWMEPMYYLIKGQRDYDEKMSRIIGGFRTHSYQEKMTIEEIQQLEITP